MKISHLLAGLLSVVSAQNSELPPNDGKFYIASFGSVQSYSGLSYFTKLAIGNSTVSPLPDREPCTSKDFCPA